MATIDIKKNLIRGKIVYYGPGLCGKTTNLEYVNRAVPNTEEMMSLSTEGDRTIFFDYLPMDLGKIRGISTNFKLYTVPGQVRYNLTRKMVLKNVDGVVFVADSQKPMMDANIESLQNLYDNLYELGIDADDVPIVLQYNKRDLPNLLTREELDEALNQDDYPVHMASAVRGEGVMETLKEIMQIVFTKLTSEFGGRSTTSKKKTKTDKRKTKARKSKPPAQAARKQEGRSEKAPVPESGKKPPEPKREPPSPPPIPRAAPPAAAAPVGGVTEDLLVKTVKEQHKELARLFEKNVDKAGLSFATSVEQKLAKLRKEIEHHIQTVESNTKQELDKLRREIARLGEKAAAAPADGSPASTLGEEVGRAVEQALQGLPSKRDFRQLRKDIAGLEEKMQGAAPDPAGAKDLGALAKRAVEEVLEGLPSKRDFQVLRKEIALLEERVKGTAGGGASVQELGHEARRAIEQATSALATKGELVGVRQEIAALAGSVKAGAAGGDSSRQAITELQRAVVDALKRLGQQTQRIEQALQALGTELRSERERAAAPARVERPTAAQEEPEETAPEPEEAAPEPEEAAPEPEEAAPEPEEAAPEPEEAAPEPEQQAPEPEETAPEPEEAAPEPEQQAPAGDEFEDDPRHKNARRVAKVMVSDLKLYYAADVDEGVKNGDIHERLKNQFDEMRKTYDMRVPEDVRAERDYLALAIDELIEKKRKEHGIE